MYLYLFSKSVSVQHTVWTSYIKFINNYIIYIYIYNMNKVTRGFSDFLYIIKYDFCVCITKDFAKQIFNTPYLRNVISIHTSRC